MRPLLTLLALASLQAMTPSAPPPTAARVHAAFAGRWQGTLRYRDYQDSTRFVSLPTLLDATMAPDSSAVTLAFTYDDGPGKTIRERDLFDLDRSRRSVRWGSATKGKTRARFAVESIAGGEADAPIRLIIARDGEDDDRPARMRETITLSAAEITVLKEVRFAPGAPWIFRHEYRMAPRKTSP